MSDKSAWLLDLVKGYNFQIQEQQRQSQPQPKPQLQPQPQPKAVTLGEWIKARREQ
jgi:hypothetical protein